MTLLKSGLVAMALAGMLIPAAPRADAQSNRAQQPAAVLNTDVLSKQGAVSRALSALQQENEWTLTQQVALCEIPAPPFKEAARAAAFRDQLRALGVTNVRIDSIGNVIGEIRGTQPGATVLLSGHLDTVFPEGTDVRVKREGTRFTAPGIADDCRGLAVILAVARQMLVTRIPITGRLLVVGTVGEEGAGNLRGVRALFSGPLRDSIDFFLSVDGIGYSITNRAVGSNRYRVTYAGPGGHSYSAFGMPNPIHAVGRAIARISGFTVPTHPKVTFNVGVVSGGQSVNAIAVSAAFEIDMRSESPAALAALDKRVQAALRQALLDERARWPGSKVGLSMQIDTIGIRPAGVTPDSSRIVRTALAAGRTLGLSTPLVSQSTDANLPISLGIPAIMIDAGGTSQGSHSLSEWYDDGREGYKGAQWVLLSVLGLTGMR